ncbi:MAG: DUF262 domain-containing protein [Bacteroides sp.]|nr:DUF262 domain-containing protein [Bacteroides sp.]
MSLENVPVKVGILELLCTSIGAQFVIPAYQRNYTWNAKKEVKQLFDDLFSVLNNERSKHFIGIMIYLEKSISPFHRERSVIDGQQRLTTIFLTLYAIKELMIEKRQDMEAEKLEQCYLINTHSETNRYKLKPLVSDDEVYQRIVTRDFANIQDKNSNVYKNFIYIKSLLGELSETFTLSEILSALDKLYIVCVPIGDEDYPQKIFESINATGAKLTASDLIRNFLLMPIISDQQDEYYSKYWKQIENLVDYDAKILEAFFRYFIISKRKTTINKNAVYQSFTKWYDEIKNELSIENIFIEIVNYAQYYNLLYKASLDKLEPELRQPIYEFRLNPSEMPAPLLMELFAIHMHTNEEGMNLISAKQLSEIITILNSYLMRRSLCGMDTSDISNYFPELLRNILNFCNGDFSSIVDTFKRYLIDSNRSNAKEMPTNNRLIECIKYANMYRLRDWVKIFFRKLESEENPAPVDFSALSIEHLMPQTATQLWMTHLGCDKEIYEENVNRLGNLTLAAKSDNSRMSNQVWEYKNKVLSTTNHLKINARLLEHERWRIEDIDKRTNELIDEIARLYPYFGSKEKHKVGIHIYIQNEEASVSAIYYPETENIEIEAGSIIKIPNEQNEYSAIFSSIRETWLQKGILTKRDGKISFAKNYLFETENDEKGNKNALDLAAMIALSDIAIDGGKWWHTENGQNITKWIEDYNLNKKQIQTLNTCSAIVITPHLFQHINQEGDILLQTKKVDWSFFSSAITLSNDCREKIQAKRGWKMRLNEKRNIKIIINGEYFDSTLHMYNYDGRPNDVLQIRYPGKESLIVLKLREICAERYQDIRQKRLNEKNGIEYRERTNDRYVHIYATDVPNVFRFKF